MAFVQDFITKIEVLDEKTPNTSTGADTPNSELEGYPLAKVIILFYIDAK